MTRPDYRAFRIGAAAHQTHDPVTWSPFINPLPDLINDARDLQPQHLGVTLWGRIVAFSLNDVRSVNACSYYPYQDLSRAWDWRRLLAEVKRIGRAEGFL